MFILPCKFNSEDPVIFSSVNSIKRYYPEEKIVVVDSCSGQLDYIQDLEKFGVIVLTGNKNYEIGAYLKAFEQYPNEDRYFCLHDSVILNGVLNKELEDVLVIQHHYMFWDGDKSNDKIKILERIGMYPAPSLAFGSMFIATNKVMKSVMKVFKENKDLLAIDKLGSQDTERILGAILYYLGFDISNKNTHGYFSAPNISNEFLTKIFKGRK